jgi:hypothetical protein
MITAVGERARVSSADDHLIHIACWCSRRIQLCCSDKPTGVSSSSPLLRGDPTPTRPVESRLSAAASRTRRRARSAHRRRTLSSLRANARMRREPSRHGRGHTSLSVAASLLERTSAPLPRRTTALSQGERSATGNHRLASARRESRRQPSEGSSRQPSGSLDGSGRLPCAQPHACLDKGLSQRDRVVTPLDGVPTPLGTLPTPLDRAPTPAGGEEAAFGREHAAARAPQARWKRRVRSSGSYLLLRTNPPK